MDEKLRKEIAREYIDGLLYGGWDDECMSVYQMKKYNITPEEYVKAQSWMTEKLKEMFGK